MKSEQLYAGLREQGFIVCGDYAAGVVNGFAVSITRFGGKSVRILLSVENIPDKAMRADIRRRLKEARVNVKTVAPVFVNIAFKADEAAPAASILYEIGRVAALLIETGVCAQDTCMICAERGADAFVEAQMIYNQPLLRAAHQRCVRDRWAEANKKADADGGSYALGILGALIGCIVGCIPTLLTI